MIKDERIVELDGIVSEVKRSEEWEEVRMTIYDMGIERGIEKGIRALIQDYVEEKQPKEKIIAKLQKHFNLDEVTALRHYDKYMQEL